MINIGEKNNIYKSRYNNIYKHIMHETTKRGCYIVQKVQLDRIELLFLGSRKIRQKYCLY